MKKIVNKQSFSLLVLGMMLISLLIAMSPVEASVTTNYHENFNNEADNANPSSTAAEGAWYTYSESNWNFSGVNHTINATYPFYINSTSKLMKHAYANFDFNTYYAYDSFSFDFAFFNTSAQHYNHSGLKFSLNGTTQMAYGKIIGNVTTSPRNSSRLLLYNNTGVLKANYTIGKGRLYRVVFTPNYSTHIMNITVYNISSSAYLCRVDVAMGSSNTKMHGFYLSNYGLLVNGRANVQVEDLLLVKTAPNYTAYSSIEQQIVIVALPVLLVIALLLLALSGAIGTPEGMVSFAIVVILVFVTIAFMFS